MRISVVLPLLLPDKFTIAMTEFAIAAMRCHAVNPFELVVVETGTNHYQSRSVGNNAIIDTYIYRPTKSSYVKDWNLGADKASGDYLVHMGNDVIAGYGWDKALLRPFEIYKDCGVTCTAATEPGAFIGPRQPLDLIVEGMFAPMMMFGKNWRLDSAYEGGYSDADLVMRIYDNGQRAYRDCSSQCHHLDRMTWSRACNDRGEAQMADGERKFYERWSNSPLMMFGVIRAGGWTYGREHESLLADIPMRGRG